MKTVLIAFILQTYVYVGVHSLDLAEMTTICSAKDPNLNECLRASTQALIPKIANGIKELNMPSMDPMYTPHVRLTEDSGDLKIDINYTNVVQTGLAKVIIEAATADLAKGVMTFNISYPVFVFVGDYVASGHIFDSVMSGDGKANITIMNSKGFLTIKFHIENDHIKEDEVTIEYTFNQILLDYSHIVFNGDEEMGNAASAFINENAIEIMNGFKPTLQRFYGGLILENLKGFFATVPYSEMFKDTIRELQGRIYTDSSTSEGITESLRVLT